ncbi:GNAT family N-acetyltransferase [Streptomyces lichenis]|uniref:GNAT family N-acetyltransferase n=1 Tax=Streptomyces lichenis TaxID=2306967 RepID=A0ABT0IEI2_9ACTN|nr:GNAT family N-acetyltransferase [Streptomyces lichenis]MCK8679746.1 GNAT family N-acetyltransferase [Streptomyces lichenis]
MTTPDSARPGHPPGTAPTPPTPPVPRIRRARAEDAEELSRLDRAVWSPLHAVQPEPHAPYAPFFDSAHRPADYLVAENADGTRIAGYIRLVPPTALPCNAHVRQIQGLAVADWARRRGLARALLRAACDEARRQGATRITLRVLGHNTPARSLYASEGFAVEGVLPGEFHLRGVAVDDVCMGRRLDGPEPV